MKLYAAALMALFGALATGCSTESINAYNEATTSRTVGIWEGDGVCETDNRGATVQLRFVFKAGVIPLTADGTTRTEFIYADGSVSGATASARAQSAMGGKGTVIEKQLLSRYGRYLNWNLMTYTSRFVDDDTWETEQCGVPILMKRVKAQS